jgi:hypothetical protein
MPVDTQNITDHHRSIGGLSEFLFYCLNCSQKPAEPTSLKIAKMRDELYWRRNNLSGLNNPVEGVSIPLNFIHVCMITELAWMPAGERLEILERHRLGKYKLLIKFLDHWKNLKLEISTDEFLRKAPLSSILAMPGIGDKQARMFLLHSRSPSSINGVYPREIINNPYYVECIPLDTHIKTWARAHGAIIPHGPLSGAAYREIELEVIVLIKTEFPHMHLADADLTIWKMMRGARKEAA